MPILDVEYIYESGEKVPADAAQRIANLAAKIYRTSPGATWVKLKRLEKKNYAENSTSIEDTPSPVFVKVLKKKLGTDVELQSEAKELASGIGSILNRVTENIHIKFESEGLGRIAFGGNLLDR